ncbi:dihydrodipicolinate synthase/N-acetylneuraminate lyase [Sphingobium xenophagum]|uniref:Dihydrodipicolinate synthase/N-acetylneuraminate lyase n=1 Tax=Sphingobium xenophagum TaxID=121428 RepID=A0ABU1X2C8_SPHXE|nr:hypothetical protein [Sphingobium xenophagum]MDR7155721.1 dihydrodipicolinate synthase/N-acetylneuraminate lyase [Sphingobium xenophagum]
MLLYLYNFPALSGITYGPSLVSLLLQRFGQRIAGLKNASGDLSLPGRSLALAGPPCLLVKRAYVKRSMGECFASCISAAANLNVLDCAAVYHQGDSEALERAVRVQALFDGLPLVPRIKSVLATKCDIPAAGTIGP